LLWVVLDTNIVVSALLNPRGLESLVLELILTGQLGLCLSGAIVAEYRDVLSRAKLRLDAVGVKRLLRQSEDLAIIVLPSQVLGISPDESDNRFLECAEAAQADYLVTGNKRHFPAVWGGTRVVNSRELLATLGRPPVS
jgi:putative PIN family toxin of toxin-antitoxin system